MNQPNILNFYKETSLYTDLGLYVNLAQKLPNDIKQLCFLQRKQMIHPINLKNQVRFKKNSFFGDMTKIPNTRLDYEEDLYPTAIGMFSELIRKDPNYTENRESTNKIHITCRGQAILLAAILKAKGIPARVRSGFTRKKDNVFHDHWLTEYYDQEKERWIMVDADMCYDAIDFDPYDIPKDKFLTAASAYLKVRSNKLATNEIYNAGYDYNFREKSCMEALLLELFYDFHCLMNDEIIFLHYPKYLKDNHFNLNEEELHELDELATLMLNPNDNFKELRNIWDHNLKFRIMTGGLNE